MNSIKQDAQSFERNKSRWRLYLHRYRMDRRSSFTFQRSLATASNVSSPRCSFDFPNPLDQWFPRVPLSMTIPRFPFQVALADIQTIPCEDRVPYSRHRGRYIGGCNGT